MAPLPCWYEQTAVLYPAKKCWWILYIVHNKVIKPCTRGKHFSLLQSVKVESLVQAVLYPVCPVNGVPWPQEPGRRNSHTFNCRMLKRPPDEVDSENPEARQQYEIMQCFTVSQPRSVPEEGEGACNTRVCTLFRLFSFLLLEFWILIATPTKTYLETFAPYNFQNAVETLWSISFPECIWKHFGRYNFQTYLEMILTNFVCPKLN